MEPATPGEPRRAARTADFIRWRAIDADATRRELRWKVVATAVAAMVAIPLVVLGIATAAGDATLRMHWSLPATCGTLTLAVCCWAAVRIRWTAGVLRRNPWVIARSQLVELGVRGRRRRLVRMLELRGAPDEVVSLIRPASRRRRSLDGMVPVVWVAGADRRFLVAAPGGGGTVRFRRVRLVHDAGADPRFTPLRSRLGRG